MTQMISHSSPYLLMSVYAGFLKIKMLKELENVKLKGLEV